MHLVDRSFGRCLRNPLLSGCAIRFTTGSFWVHAETTTVLRAVAVDFVFNFWCLEILSDNSIRHVPMCDHYHAKSFSLEAL
jgi:hypothetical protein